MKLLPDHLRKLITFSFKAIIATFLALFLFQIASGASTNEDSGKTFEQLYAELRLTVVGEEIHLNWKGHEDVEYYEVEVASEINSQGDLIFTKMKEIDISLSQDYAFVDKKTEKEGLLYYRIKVYSIDGEVITSDIHTANFIYKDNFVLNVYTDEFLSDLELQINSHSNGTAEFSLTGVATDYTLAKKIDLSEGVNRVIIELEKKLPKGAYLLTFSYNGDTQYVMIEKKKDSKLIVVQD